MHAARVQLLEPYIVANVLGNQDGLDVRVSQQPARRWLFNLIIMIYTGTYITERCMHSYH